MFFSFIYFHQIMTPDRTVFFGFLYQRDTSFTFSLLEPEFSGKFKKYVSKFLFFSNGSEQETMTLISEWPNFYQETQHRLKNQIFNIYNGSAMLDFNLITTFFCKKNVLNIASIIQKRSSYNRTLALYGIGQVAKPASDQTLKQFLVRKPLNQ